MASANSRTGRPSGTGLTPSVVGPAGPAARPRWCGPRPRRMSHAIVLQFRNLAARMSVRERPRWGAQPTRRRRSRSRGASVQPSARFRWAPETAAPHRPRCWSTWVGQPPIEGRGGMVGWWGGGVVARQQGACCCCVWGGCGVVVYLGEEPRFHTKYSGQHVTPQPHTNTTA